MSNVATIGTTKTFVVTWASNWMGYNYFFIDAVQQATIELHEHQKYIFDLSQPGSAHPFRLSTLANGGGAQNGSGTLPASDYTTGVDYSVTDKLILNVQPGAPSTLYYYCTLHSGMGGQINISPTAELIVSGDVSVSSNLEVSNINFTGALTQNGTTFSSGGASPWTTTGNDLSYTTGAVGLGTNTPSVRLHITPVPVSGGPILSSPLAEWGSLQEALYTVSSQSSTNCVVLGVADDSNGNIYLAGYYHADSTWNLGNSITLPSTNSNKKWFYN